MTQATLLRVLRHCLKANSQEEEKRYTACPTRLLILGNTIECELGFSFVGSMTRPERKKIGVHTDLIVTSSIAVFDSSVDPAGSYAISRGIIKRSVA
jgi:hypothetical protein